MTATTDPGENASRSEVPLIERPGARRRAGIAMQIVAYIGVFASLVGTVAVWRLLGSVEDTVNESLILTGETLVTLDRTIVVADEVLDSVDQALLDAGSTLEALETNVAGSTDVLGSLTDLVGTVGPSLRGVSDTLDSVASLAGTIDSVLRQLDDIPFGPNYNPEAELDDQIRQLALDLTPIVDSLEDSAAELDEFTTQAGELEDRLGAFTDAIAEVNTDLSASAVLLDDYRASAGRAATLSEQAQSDLRGDIRLARALVLIVGLAVAAGQVVPFWVGKELVAAAERRAASPKAPLLE